MKRTELTRRTPLKPRPRRGDPSNSEPQQTRAESSKRRAPIRQQSNRAAAAQRERVKILKSMLGHTGRALCSVTGCGREAVDADEIVLRSQLEDAATIEDNIQLLCRPHHDWKHANPNAAEAAGLYVRGSTHRAT